jgi:hypothetical protein
MSKILKALGSATLAVMLAGPALAQPTQPGGVFVAGDLWETFLPTNVAKSYQEQQDNPNTSWFLFRVGNLDRQWTTPTQMYPGGENLHIPWKQAIEMIEYSPDPNFNNFTTASDPAAKNYAFGFETSKLARTGNLWPTDAKADWTDATKRNQVLYQGGTPTNLGVNVNYRIRQYTLNHANMNDFIAIELELTNTGILDVNGDGIAEKTDNKINALVLNMRSEPINSMTNSLAGRRGASGWFTGPTSGYDGTPDENGMPWDVPVNFTGPAPGSLTPNGPFGYPWAPDGSRRLGLTMNSRGHYYDVYTGSQWIAAKKGALPATDAASSVVQENKKTIFDSHGVGEGLQRGWFTSTNKGYGNDDHEPWTNHTLSMGTFYEVGGKTSDKTSFKLLPDPNWFDPTTPGITAGNPLTFINAVKPEAQRGKPRGDMKYNGTFSQNWERNNPNSADDWTEGYAIAHGFDGDFYMGVGPFSLEVGETINLVLVEYGGFRLKGVRNARKAAQWAYENGWVVPEAPPTPVISVQPNSDLKVTVKWDARAEQASDFAGYKVYRSTLFPRVSSELVGTRMLDTYQTQTQEEPTDAQLGALGAANNPNISAATAYRDQEPGAWGPYKLVKNITSSQLSSYLNTDSDSGDYKYAFADNSDLVAFGFTYYYYVAAYDNESGSIAGKPFSTLESHKNNFNGRSGLWEGTYHYATANSFFPGGNDLAALKNIGAAFILKAPLASATDLISGTLKVQVKPNPYKRQALHDTGTQHKILFTNLATGTKITILDVAGQIVDVLEFNGTNQFDGTLFWDMFSKDGIEAASGLYIYVAQYPGGQQTGHFAILR